METKRLLTVEQAAAYLQVCTESVRRWIKEKKLPASKLPKGYRIDSDDLNNFVKGEK